MIEATDHAEPSGRPKERGYWPIGRVSNSGEGRWTSIAAIDVSAPAPVLTTALYARFSSRGEADFADQVLSAMRFGFGGHAERPDAAAG